MKKDSIALAIGIFTMGVINFLTVLEIADIFKIMSRRIDLVSDEVIELKKRVNEKY